MDKKNFLEKNSKYILNSEVSKVIWPPIADNKELKELSSQRNLDIGIKWKAWPIKEFEEKFLNFLWNKIDYSITFNSGTSWLFAAYFAIWLKKWDEIIWPAVTYHAALSPAFSLWVVVKLCDVDIDTKCIDPEKIESLITPRTKAITVVHQWWHPCDMDRINEIAKKYNLFIIEDCSHSHWSKYKWKMCWTLWDVSVFSLQTNKTIFAGEWWILVTNNIDIYERATLLWHYRDRCKSEIKTKERQELWSTWYWLKLRMSPFNAIVWINSLDKFEDLKASKHKCLNYLNERLKEISYIRPLKIDSVVYDMWAWYWFKPLFNNDSINISIWDIVKVFKDFNLDIKKPSWWSLTNYKLYTSDYNLLFPDISSFDNSNLDLPNSNYLDNFSFSFPTFYDWDKHKELIDKYIDTLKFIDLNISDIKKIWKI